MIESILSADPLAESNNISWVAKGDQLIVWLQFF